MRVWNKRDRNVPSNAVYVGRPTKFGNPFQITAHQSRETVIALYTSYIEGYPELMEAARRELRGRDLVCWCAPHACHADVLARIANGGAS